MRILTKRTTQTQSGNTEYVSRKHSVVVLFVFVIMAIEIGNGRVDG